MPYDVRGPNRDQKKQAIVVRVQPIQNKWLYRGDPKEFMGITVALLFCMCCFTFPHGPNAYQPPSARCCYWIFEDRSASRIVAPSGCILQPEITPIQLHSKRAICSLAGTTFQREAHCATVICRFEKGFNAFDLVGYCLI